MCKRIILISLSLFLFLIVDSGFRRNDERSRYGERSGHGGGAYCPYSHAANSEEQSVNETSPLIVFVSILPQAYFVKRIGGAHVQVEVLVGPGKSHHTYEATPRQLTDLAKADVFFRIGVPFENILVTRITFTMENLLVVDTHKQVPLRHFAESNGQGKPDPHIWLDPRLVKMQCQPIFDTLSQLRPQCQAEFATSLNHFLSDLESLDRELRNLLQPVQGREVYVFHPAYGYFLEAYGLKQVPIEVEGKEPGPHHLARIIDQMKQDQVKVLFVQPQFSRKVAETIAQAVGAKIISIDPLAEDYLQNLLETGRKIRAAFQ